MIPEKIIDWLLEDDNPSVKYYTLTSLLEKPYNDEDVINARKAIMEYGLVPQIVEQQNEDGSWGIPDKFYTLKYTGTVWVLLLLSELAADPQDPAIKKACEFVLAHSQNEESGGFSYKQSSKSETGLASCVIPCLTGNMVYSLIRLGYLDDSRVRKSIDWITRYQRADDGDDKAPEGEIYKNLTACWGKHSCHMGAAKTLKALASIPPDKRSSDTNNKIAQLTDYFLKHHLYKKSHNLNEISRPGWLKLGFPLMYQTDILELLGIFSDLSIKDPRLADAVEIIKNKKLPDGTWKLENSNNGKMVVDVETKGQSSKWITYKALVVLKQYDTL